jgi:hypothetical protein
MATKPGRPSDDVWSAPESGTVRDDTSGNQPSDRGVNPGQGRAFADQGGTHPGEPQCVDDPAIASEER